jgi:hypothetical protein
MDQQEMMKRTFSANYHPVVEQLHHFVSNLRWLRVNVSYLNAMSLSGRSIQREVLSAVHNRIGRRNSIRAAAVAVHQPN